MPNVLVVDDERDLVSLLDFNLRQSGFETTLAYAGEEALSAARRRPPDLVLLDLMLPDQHWINIFRQLRLNDKSSRLPVIVVSAIANEVKAELNGDVIYVVDWIPKPINEKLSD